ncbi:MAG TPA: tetratricopeptide repeat protein [Burkholderiaceae bacterium]|nr:tetratricopeptide repeat protein [Burkholderiaceae bacterium]
MPPHPIAVLVLAIVLALSAGASAADDLSDARAAFDREDYAQAYALYAPLAAQKNAEAQYRVGLMLKFGWGVDKNLSEAAGAFRQAAEKNHAESQAELGRLYKDGSGVPRDLTEAYAWLTLAATNGYMDAMSYRTRLQHEMTAEQVRAGERLALQRRGKTPEPGR